METIKIENVSEEEFYKIFKCQKNHFDKNASFDGFILAVSPNVK